jgi:hypothetical protein
MDHTSTVRTSPSIDISRVPPQGPEISITTQDRPPGLVRRDDHDGGTIPTGSGTARTQGSQEISRPTQLETQKKPHILLRILAAIPEICANIVLLGAPALQKYMESRGMAREPYNFTLPGTHGRKVEVDGHIGPKKIPKGMTHDEVQAQLQDKINAGHKVYESVMNGTRTDGCTVDDVTNLMFFLQVRGEDQQGSCFKDGTFNLPDPDGKLRKFLDSCPEAYQRSSSLAPDEGHRGIDAYGSAKKKDQLLPHHMKTLHYFSVPQSETMPEGRIILKMERNGKFYSRPKVSDPDGPSRQSNRHDLGATMKHVFKGTVKPGEQSFTEHLPPAVKHEYREIMRYLPPEARAEMERNGPFTREGGIRVMHENANRVLAGAYDGAPELTEEVMDKLKVFINKLHENYPDPQVRFGNEVVFSSDNLISEPEPEIESEPEPEIEVQRDEPPTLTSVGRQSLPPGPMLTSEPEMVPLSQFDLTYHPHPIEDEDLSGRLGKLGEDLQTWGETTFTDEPAPREHTRLTAALTRYNELMAQSVEPELNLFGDDPDPEAVLESHEQRKEALEASARELREALNGFMGRIRTDDEPGLEDIMGVVEQLHQDISAL